MSKRSRFVILKKRSMDWFNNSLCDSFRVEDKMKGALFGRSRRKVTLTDAGRIFLPKASKLLTNAEDAYEMRRQPLKVELVLCGSASVLLR